MKTLSALVFSLLFLTGSIFAQQQPGTAQQDSNSGSDYKVAKKSVSKAKAGKKQSAAAVDADGVPVARARHVENLAKAIPGNGGETPNGPAGAAEDAFQQRAFPDADIPLERLLAARSAAANLKSRNFPTGKGRPGTWVTVGPSEAIYPLTPLRTSSVYVPNKYDAASRTTALAISPNCVTGHCTLWAPPRRRRHLANQECSRGGTELDVPVGVVCHQFRWLHRRRSERPQRQYALGRHR